MMERKLFKEEVKAIRLVLGIHQKEFADFLGVSISQLSRTEQSSKHSYDVSDKLDQKIKETLKQMDIDIEETLEIAKKRGYLK